MAKEKGKTAAVILAGGSGSRMNMSATKQKLKICGKSVLKRTLEAFDASLMTDSITIVCKEGEEDFAMRESAEIKKPLNIVIGGSCRAESAKSGFNAIPKNSCYVMIHDAARCLISPEDIDRVATDAYLYGAASASYEVSDTVKLCDSEGNIMSTVPRAGICYVQTPQAFSVDLYKKALDFAVTLDSSVTDDNMLIEAIGVKVHATTTSKSNIKITTSSDIELAEYIIGKEKTV